MTNRYVLIRNLAILFIACNLLFWLFPFPPIIWRLSLVVLSVIAIFNKKVYLPCEKAVLFFIAFNLLHFIISFLWKTPSSTSIGNILCGLLSLALFSFLSEKGMMTTKAFSVIAIILVIVSIICYNYYSMLLISRFTTDNITNSNSEFFLMLLPLFFYVKKPVLKWTLLLVCLFFLIQGAKRGNIIAAIIPIVLLLYQSLKDSKRSIIKMVLILVLIAGASYLVYNWTSSNEFFLYRLEQTIDGDSSNRDKIYKSAWNIWYNSKNVLNFVFGYGYDGVFNRIRVAAHNDWLEILVDYGLLGVLLYLMVYVRFARQIRVTKDQELKIVILSAVSILFVKSLFSMSFNTGSLPLLMVSLGTALGQYTSSQTQ